MNESEIVLLALKDNIVILGELLEVENDVYYLHAPQQIIIDLSVDPPKLIPYSYPLVHNQLFLKNTLNIEKISKDEIIRLYTSKELINGLEDDYKKYIDNIKRHKINVNVVEEKHYTIH